MPRMITAASVAVAAERVGKVRTLSDSRSTWSWALLKPEAVVGSQVGRVAGAADPRPATLDPRRNQQPVTRDPKRPGPPGSARTFLLSNDLSSPDICVMESQYRCDGDGKIQYRGANDGFWIRIATPSFFFSDRQPRRVRHVLAPQATPRPCQPSRQPGNPVHPNHPAPRRQRQGMEEPARAAVRRLDALVRLLRAHVLSELAILAHPEGKAPHQRPRLTAYAQSAPRAGRQGNIWSRSTCAHSPPPEGMQRRSAAPCSRL